MGRRHAYDVHIQGHICHQGHLITVGKGSRSSTHDALWCWGLKVFNPQGLVGLQAE